jgi:hypothetical protein
MQTLVEDMNYIINSIWSYPMEIKPCNLEDGELDYLFPVVSDNRGFSNDINQTSIPKKDYEQYKKLREENTASF